MWRRQLSYLLDGMSWMVFVRLKGGLRRLSSGQTANVVGCAPAGIYEVMIHECMTSGAVWMCGQRVLAVLSANSESLSVTALKADLAARAAPCHDAESVRRAPVSAFRTKRGNGRVALGTWLEDPRGPAIRN